jgi:hypothetical protein
MNVSSGIGRVIAIVLGLMFAWWLFKFVLHMLFGLIQVLIIIALILFIYRMATGKRAI